MNMGPELLWWVLAAISALVLPVVLQLLFTPGSAVTAKAVSRMRAVAPSERPGDRVLLDIAQRTSGRTPFLRNVEHMVEASDLAMTGRSFLALTATGATCLGLLAGFLSGSMLIGIGLAGTALLLPVSLLRARHARKVDAFAGQLPDALDLMMRGLRIGHPISATISNVARTMPDPIGAEFRIIAQKIDHGDYLTDAFSDLAEKMGQEDMHYLAVSIRIQHGTGGNLADMLGTLSKVIRQRIMLRRRVRALSSEGRISSMLLSSLPLVIYGATSLLAPDYYGAVQDHPMFLPIAAVILALVLANFLILRRLVNFQA